MAKELVSSPKSNSKLSKSLSKRQTRPKLSRQIIRCRYLYLMLLLPVIHLFLFRYLPMAGVVVAFKKFNVFKGIWASPWVGLAHFQEAFASDQFWLAVKNTLLLNVGDLILGFPLPIILAILLFEINSKKLKNSTQIITYLPNFLSWVIIAGIVQQVFSHTGLINTFLGDIGLAKIPFLSNDNMWRGVYWIAGIWKNTGYSLIVYMAALSGVDTSLYEAVYLDGAGRFKRIWHVTLPQIRPTIAVMLILNLGKIIAIDFDRPYMLSNALVTRASDVLSIFVYKVGLSAGRFDFATAVGLFQSVIAVVMILAVNKVIKKLGEDGIV